MSGSTRLAPAERPSGGMATRVESVPVSWLVGRTHGDRRFRSILLQQGYTLPPRRRPHGIWKDWVNRPLRTAAEVDRAVSEVEACGLVTHPGRPKNWDLLVALGSILEHTNTRAAVLDMGAARYSKLLPWLYAFGYRRLAGIDLVPTGLVHTGSIEHLVMDLTATTFPDAAFDAISCLSVIEHGVSPERYAREVARLLRPGGIAILSTDFWCSPIDTQGKVAYGVPVHVLAPAEIETWVEVAARYGLRPVSPVTFGCEDRVVHWKRLDLRFTFIDLVLTRDRGGLRDRLGRSRYRRGANPAAPPPAAVRQDDADADLPDATRAP